MSNDKTLELQIRIAAEDAARIVSTLKGDLKGLADEAAKYAKNEGASLNRTFKEAETAAKNTSTNIGDIKRALGNLAEVAAAAKALSLIKDMGSFALKTADNFKTMKNQFGILLGDMEAGIGLFSEIKAFNDITPFDLDTLTQATNVLISAKVPLEDLQDQLTKFGDLSQGNSQRLTSYVHAFSIAAAKGKADMQVLNTYLNQGVPILDSLAKNFGVTTAEIVKMSSDGQISFEAFSAALDDLTAAGGRYFGGMELASKSLSAMQEGLSEAVNTLAASYGDILLPAANAALGALTSITNAINESPILKGLFAAALVAVTGYLASMAVKAGIALAAQMSLNFAIGALNPAVLAATIAVAGLAAGYTAISSKVQEAALAEANHEWAIRKKTGALNEAADAAQKYADSYNSMTGIEIANVMRLAEGDVNRIKNEIEIKKQELERFINSYNEARNALGDLFSNHFVDKPIEQTQLEFDIGQLNLQLEEAQAKMKAVYDGYNQFRQGITSAPSNEMTAWIEQLYGSTQDARIEKINDQLKKAAEYLSGANLNETDKNRLQVIIKGLNEELDRFKEKAPDINKIASEWKEAWSDVYGQFKADEADDPFFRIEQERNKRLAEARKNHLERDLDTINQINNYYNAQRSDVIRHLADEEERLQRELSKTKVDDIEYELQEALRAIDTLETKRIIAAGDSEEEIAAIKKRFDELREGTNTQFKVRIDAAILEESATEMSKWIDQMFGNTQAAQIERINEQLEKANKYLSGTDNDVDKNRLIAIIKGLNEEIGRLNENVTAESWIDQMFGNTQAARIEKINEQLEKANKYLSDDTLDDTNKNRLQIIIEGLNQELDRFTDKASESERAASQWLNSWEEAWSQFQADQAGDLFYNIEQERIKRLADAEKYFEDNKELIDDINEYYDSQRSKIIDKLADEEKRAMKELAENKDRIERNLTKTRIDDLEYELQKALRDIDELEEYRVLAAGESEEEIAAIRERFAQLREDTVIRFRIEIEKASLQEARDAVKNWQEELSDSLLRLLIKMDEFSTEAAVILSDLSSQLIQLSANAALSGFEEFGRAMSEGEGAIESMSRALSQMSQQILKQLPMMFLQAGLQLIANGQWPLGLSFIAAAGTAALISGYVDAANSAKTEASRHSNGGVFNEYEKTARAYAAGGAFTNQIVSAPTYIAHGGGFGLMGEAGPEAIMPLTRMANGNLGVQTAGANVYVNINNYSGENVKQEETQDANGNTNLEITIGNAINKHLTSGKADRPMVSRFGVRPVGV